jgi:hypothetical protein
LKRNGNWEDSRIEKSQQGQIMMIEKKYEEVYLKPTVERIANSCVKNPHTRRAILCELKWFM